MPKAPAPSLRTPSVADMSPLLKGQTMDTLYQPPDTGPDPQAATLYFRRLAAERAADELAAWYPGDPGPWAA